MSANHSLLNFWPVFVVTSIISIFVSSVSAAADSPALGHWLFSLDRVKGATIQAVVGPDATIEGLGRAFDHIQHRSWIPNTVPSGVGTVEQQRQRRICKRKQYQKDGELAFNGSHRLQTSSTVDIEKQYDSVSVIDSGAERQQHLKRNAKTFMQPG